MEDLEDLRLHENEMTGKIPDSLYSIRKLKQLWLQDTLHCENVAGVGWSCAADSTVGFDGTISTKIGNLKKLKVLLINNNPIGGVIPTEIGLCEDLCEFHFILHCLFACYNLPLMDSLKILFIFVSGSTSAHS